MTFQEDRYKPVSEPFVEELLHPTGNGNSSNVTALSDEIDDRPTILAPLKMIETEVGQFTSTKTAAEQNGNDRSVALALEGFGSGDCHRSRASFGDNQFPSRIPSFLTPFTRRIPAASSGLRSPASAASYASRRTAANLTLIVPGERLRDSR